MTDDQPSPHDEQVRRLLADARHDAPLPAEVAARLDGVLADLAREGDGVAPAPPTAPTAPTAPTSTVPPAPVVDLAARRRRRQGAALLVAAAAVVAIGVGVGAVVEPTDDASSGEAGGASDSAFDRGEAQDESGAGAPAAPSAEPPPEAGLARMRPVPVSADTFAADAERYRDRAEQAAPRLAPEGDAEPGFACEPTETGAGTALPVLFDGAEALLVYRPATGDSQVVDLLQCGTADVLRTTTLPVP